LPAAFDNVMAPNDVPITSPLTIGIAYFFGIVGTRRKGVLKNFPVPLAGQKIATHVAAKGAS
jgi:hypothetical protein